MDQIFRPDRRRRKLLVLPDEESQSTGAHMAVDDCPSAPSVTFDKGRMPMSWDSPRGRVQDFAQATGDRPLYGGRSWQSVTQVGPAAERAIS